MLEGVNRQLSERMKAKVGELGSRLKMRGTEESLVASLFADDTILLVENGGTLQMIVDEFDRLCKRRKRRANAGKSKTG